MLHWQLKFSILRFTNLIQILLCSDIVFQKFYKPVGEVDVGCSIGWGGVVFEEAGDADVEVWEGEDLLLPVFEGVDVGEDDDLSAFEGAEAF